MAERVGPRLQRLSSFYSGFPDLEVSSFGHDDVHLPKEIPAPSAAWGTRLVRGAPWVDLVAIHDRSYDVPSSVLVDTSIDSESDGRAYLTGRIPLGSLGEVMRTPAFEFVDVPSTVRLELDVSGPEIGFPAVRNHPTSPRAGTGVVIGVVDRGVDITHPGLCDAAGNSRVVRLWDQGLTAVGAEASPAGRSYGVGWTGSDIDAGLVAGRHVGSTHGTQVAGIAAGNGRDSAGAVTAYVGGAPDSDIVVVAVDTATGLSNSKHVADAVVYVFAVADELGVPAVVNLSMGDPNGPHDGTAWLEQALANLIKPGRLLVKSAGNGASDGGHAARDIASGATVDLSFDVPPGSPSLQCLQLWYGARAQLDVQVVPPGGPATRPIPANSAQQNLPCYDNTQKIKSIAVVLSEIGCLCNGDNCITISLVGAPTLASGTWAVRVTNPGQGPPAHVDVWFDAAAKNPVFRLPDRDDDGTITTPCAVPDLITVGSYSVSPATFGDLSDVSSRGPTRTGTQAPTLTAPGETITTCVPTPASAYYAAAPRGTSFAAPHVTAAAALMLQAHPNATAQDVIDCLTSTARPAGSGAPTGWGAGKLDVDAAVQRLDNKLGP